MLAADSGFELTDLTHASALLLGISIGVYVTLRIVKLVLDETIRRFGPGREEEPPE